MPTSGSYVPAFVTTADGGGDSSPQPPPPTQPQADPTLLDAALSKLKYLFTPGIDTPGPPEQPHIGANPERDWLDRLPDSVREGLDYPVTRAREAVDRVFSIPAITAAQNLHGLYGAAMAPRGGGGLSEALSAEALRRTPPTGITLTDPAEPSPPSLLQRAFGRPTDNPKVNAPYLYGPDGRLILSTRVPTAVANEPAPAGTAPYRTTLEEAKLDPENYRKIAQFALTSPLLTNAEKIRWAGDPESALQAVRERSGENISYTVNQQERVNPGVNAVSGLWYPGAHQFALDLASRFGHPVEAGSAVLAALSPGTEWPINMELAKRISNNWAELNQTNPVFDDEVYNQFAQRKLDSINAVAAKNISQGTATKQEAQDYIAKKTAWIRNVETEAKGKRWRDLPIEHQAIMLRALSELNDPNQYSLYHPTGQWLGLARNKPSPVQAKLGERGDPAGLGFQSYPNIIKVLQILNDPSAENISNVLGGNKVRNFFNNINSPWDRSGATVDVQHLAASHMQPLGADSDLVESILGHTSSAFTGMGGSYPLYHDAILDAAQANGNIIPNVMQAQAWEALKGLFSPEDKRSEPMINGMNRIFGEYQSGKMSLEQARENILDLVASVHGTAIRRPYWFGRDTNNQ